MTRAQLGDTIATLRDTLLSGPKMIGASSAVVVSAIFHGFSSIFFPLMCGFWLSDLLLGTLKSAHRGIPFEWSRFWRAVIKLAAGCAGVAFFALLDLFGHALGSPADWTPATAVGLAAMCWAFASSAGQHVAYFFPELGPWLMRLVSKVRPVELRHRRAEDLE